MMLGEIIKSNTQKLILELRTYEGNQYIDVRTWYLPDNETEWRPTKKAVTLPPRLIDEFIEVLQKAREGAAK